ncbi:MAG: response regulator transcription factor [Thermomicrobium sp.]|nr:response regulator transcription factor [Thermomicrobium sp.]MDW8058827.1 response regulator transcription factor [Thermomicrobium sp.]
MARILLVEDDETLQLTIRYNLERAGHEVTCVSDGETALEHAHASRPDLVILDVMLPGLDGFEVCRRLRERSTVPILILTARDDEIDRVLGLELGADDYLTKPFSMRELVARVKALLRRRELLARELGSEPAADQYLTVGPLRIDLAQRRVWRDEREVPLKPREFELLAYLARHRERVCRSEEILRAVWGYETFGDHRTLAVHVHGLREKLEDDPRHPRLIETVRGIGYRLTARHLQATSR